MFQTENIISWGLGVMLSGHEVKRLLSPAKQINLFLCTVMKEYGLKAYKSAVYLLPA